MCPQDNPDLREMYMLYTRTGQHRYPAHAQTFTPFEFEVPNMLLSSYSLIRLHVRVLNILDWYSNMHQEYHNYTRGRRL